MCENCTCESEEAVVSEGSGASFSTELEQLLNRHSLENESNTPDFILARYLQSCLEAFNQASKLKDAWHNGAFDNDDND